MPHRFVLCVGGAAAVLAPDEVAAQLRLMTVGPDSALYVSDDENGRVYRIVWQP